MKSLSAHLENKVVKTRDLWLVFLVALLSLSLRLYHLGYHDFWYDETFTGTNISYAWSRWNVPLYYILMHFWIKIFGVSEFSIRFPSLIFSFFTVIFVFLLGKSLFNKKIGVIASLLTGLSPFHLWYAQEARDYSMALFLGTLSSYFFLRVVKEGKNKLWLYFTAVSILGLYTDYFYIFLFLAQGMYILILKRRKLRFKEILYFLFIVTSFLLFLPKFLRKFYFVRQGFWIPEPTWGSLIITLENFTLGYNGHLLLYIISDILAGVFLIFALWNARKNGLKQNLIFCIFLFFVPIICVFCFSKLFFPVYLDRGLIIFSPYYYIILAVGITSLNKKVTIHLFSLFILLVLICDYNYFRDWMVIPFKHRLGACLKKPVKPIVKFLEDNIEPTKDIVAFTNQNIKVSIDFYYKKRSYPNYYLFDAQFLEPNWRRTIQESRYDVPFSKIKNLKFKRLWVLYSDWERSGWLDENSQSVKDWLDKNLRLEFIKEFDGLLISRYVRD